PDRSTEQYDPNSTSAVTWFAGSAAYMHARTPPSECPPTAQRSTPGARLCQVVSGRVSTIAKLRAGRAITTVTPDAATPLSLSAYAAGSTRAPAKKTRPWSLGRGGVSTTPSACSVMVTVVPASASGSCSAIRGLAAHARVPAATVAITIAAIVTPVRMRSEERRVGKEGRGGRGAADDKTNERRS